MDIQGKIALVTGANRGIGRAIVESLLSHGADKVYLAVRNPDSVSDLEADYGQRVIALPLDLSDAASIAALPASAKDVQIVVNNAGVLELADPLMPEFETGFEHELMVNVLGLVRMAQAFAPVLEANGGGAFVQLNSVASILNFTGLTSYSASKAAAYSITQGLREKLKPLGVQVISVHPGPIATDMIQKAGIEMAASPASTVGEAIVAALAKQDFHLFPDEFSQQIGQAYQSFADNVINAEQTSE